MAASSGDGANGANIGNVAIPTETGGAAGKRKPATETPQQQEDGEVPAPRAATPLPMPPTKARRIGPTSTIDEPSAVPPTDVQPVDRSVSTTPDPNRGAQPSEKDDGSDEGIFDPSGESQSGEPNAEPTYVCVRRDLLLEALGMRFKKLLESQCKIEEKCGKVRGEVDLLSRLLTTEPPEPRPHPSGPEVPDLEGPGPTEERAAKKRRTTNDDWYPQRMQGDGKPWWVDSSQWMSLATSQGTVDIWCDKKTGKMYSWDGERDCWVSWRPRAPATNE